MLAYLNLRNGSAGVAAVPLAFTRPDTCYMGYRDENSHVGGGKCVRDTGEGVSPDPPMTNPILQLRTGRTWGYVGCFRRKKVLIMSTTEDAILYGSNKDNYCSSSDEEPDTELKTACSETESNYPLPARTGSKHGSTNRAGVSLNVS